MIINAEHWTSRKPIQILSGSVAVNASFAKNKKVAGKINCIKLSMKSTRWYQIETLRQQIRR